MTRPAIPESKLPLEKQRELVKWCTEHDPKFQLIKESYKEHDDLTHATYLGTEGCIQVHDEPLCGGVFLFPYLTNQEDAVRVTKEVIKSFNKYQKEMYTNHLREYLGIKNNNDYFQNLWMNVLEASTAEPWMLVAAVKKASE